jgi:hypothetical protein
MNPTSVRLSAATLSTVLLAGCGTPYVPMDNWTYSGTDEGLRAPPRVPRGNLSESAWIAVLAESKTRWFGERDAVIEQAKENCVRETGESKTPGYWFGYSGSFKACMAAKGWSVGRSPL